MGKEYKIYEVLTKSATNYNEKFPGVERYRVIDEADLPTGVRKGLDVYCGIFLYFKRNIYIMETPNGRGQLSSYRTPVYDKIMKYINHKEKINSYINKL